jgi:hypothetical protein
MTDLIDNAIWTEHLRRCIRCVRIKENPDPNVFYCDECQAANTLFPGGERNRTRRCHDFVTASMLRNIPGLYATENTPYADKTFHVHYFVGRCHWYIAELDPETGDAFGYCDLGAGCPEWGYVNLRELEAMVVKGSFVVERELDFTLCTVSGLGLRA